MTMKAQGFKKGSGFPSRRDAQTVVDEAIPAAVDAESNRIEAADDDAGAAHTRCANAGILKQSLASSKEMTDDGIDHHLGARHLVVLAD